LKVYFFSLVKCNKYNRDLLFHVADNFFINSNISFKIEKFKEKKNEILKEMSSINFIEEIKQKNLNERQKNFVSKLIKIGGSFKNNDLAKLWGTKTFPTKFKKLLLEKPSILKLIQAKPQKYILEKKKEKNRIISKKSKIVDTFQDYDYLKHEFDNFKDKVTQNFQTLFSEVENLKRLINNLQPEEFSEGYKIGISELEKEIFIIYNQLKNRPHQPIKIESIWQELYNKYPNYNWKTFADQILKINSKSYHLEEGTAGRYIYDPNSNKKYGYVIGN